MSDRVIFLTNQVGAVPFASSGFNGFNIPVAEASSGDVGPGTQYPLGFSLLELVELFWRVKKIRIPSISCEITNYFESFNNNSSQKTATLTGGGIDVPLRPLSSRERDLLLDLSMTPTIGLNAPYSDQLFWDGGEGDPGDHIITRNVTLVTSSPSFALLGGAQLQMCTPGYYPAPVPDRNYSNPILKYDGQYYPRLRFLISASTSSISYAWGDFYTDSPTVHAYVDANPPDAVGSYEIFGPGTDGGSDSGGVNVWDSAGDISGTTQDINFLGKSLTLCMATNPVSGYDTPSSTLSMGDIEAVEWWPYAAEDGSPIWDASSGAPLQDPRN